MKKSILFSLAASIAVILPVKAQMLIPEFSEPILIEDLSSSAEESMPITFNNGEGIYFYRTYVQGEGENTKIKGQDIWTSTKKKNGWKSPYRLFRADYLKASASIIGSSDDGNRIYLFITKYLEKGKQQKLVYLDQTGKDEWSQMKEIKVDSLEFNERYFSFYMTNNAEILLISMSPSESLLDEDLFVSLKKEDGSYTRPKSLGPTINTRKYEVAPFMGKDGTTLYFASNGLGGLGEADIFVSKRLDDSWRKWSKPVNLGSPINSEGVDAYFSIGNQKEVFFTSDRGLQQSSIYRAIATGEFKYAYSDSVNGQFFYKGLPAENVTLQLFDLDGNVVDEIVTDAYGKFKYKKLATDNNVMLKIKVEEDDETYLGSKIYFTDDSGKRVRRMIFTESGSFINENEIAEREQIQGVYKYNDAVMKNASLVLYDENRFAVDTIYTDKEGKFNYMKNKHDQKFTILPIEKVDEEREMNIYLTDADGNKTLELISEKDQYTFVAVNERRTDQVTENTLSSGLSKRSTKMESLSGLPDDQKRYYFDFAKNELSKNSKKKLSEIAELIAEKPSIQVELIGHTDAIGTLEDNQLRGLQRANNVKEYLISIGVSPNTIIKVSSKGETEPLMTNDTEKGRSNNRRVELIIR